MGGPRVLMVDDDSFAFSVIESFVDQMHSHPHFEWSGTYEDGLARLTAGGWDACLLDYQLGTRSGLDFLRAAIAAGVRTPIIMLTAHREHTVDVEAMESGATDYLVKGEFDAEVLDRVLRYAVERKRTLEKLRESEERYALAVAGASDGIWDWRLAEDTLYLSARWKQMIGFDDFEFASRMDAWLERMHEEDRDRFRVDLQAHITSTTHSFENEHRLLHRDGTWRWVLARAVAVRDKSGKATRMAGSLSDVTNSRSRDPLTGLANRVLYMDRLERAFARRKRDPSHSFAVVFLDLDRFKVVNDSLGHFAGDALLIGVARRLEKCIRAVDSVARLGGDEFTLMLDGISDANIAIKVAIRILEDIAKPFEIAGRPVYTGGSLGIAMLRPEYLRPEEILRDADTAMYRAKVGGKGRYQIFDHKMHEQAMAVMQLEGELRAGLERGELRAHYQPIYQMGDGALIGFEALVRWDHPRLGLVTPEKFIPLAEETGLVRHINHWMLREACRQMSEWRRTVPGAQELRVSVNASKLEFDAPELVERVLKALDSVALPHDALVLEITEGLLFDNPEKVVNTLARLKDAGVGVVMDDFGTGYSSLSYLHKLPITGLKVDRAFVSRLEAAESSRETVKAIVALAHGLGLVVTAEGVETEAQASIVRALGCEFAQGYLYSRPVDAGAAEALAHRKGRPAAAEPATARPAVASLTPT